MCSSKCVLLTPQQPPCPRSTRSPITYRVDLAHNNCGLACSGGEIELLLKFAQHKEAAGVLPCSLQQQHRHQQQWIPRHNISTYDDDQLTGCNVIVGELLQANQINRIHLKGTLNGRATTATREMRKKNSASPRRSQLSFDKYKSDIMRRPF